MAVLIQVCSCSGFCSDHTTSGHHFPVQVENNVYPFTSISSLSFEAHTCIILSTNSNVSWHVNGLVCVVVSTVISDLLDWLAIHGTVVIVSSSSFICWAFST
ncbi:hypothetical protein AcW2_005761 [Taiwanofungus camphoratus]|nr:hypothetical protein AcW2_005761 [Antrodia cinnamomea]